MEHGKNFGWPQVFLNVKSKYELEIQTAYISFKMSTLSAICIHTLSVRQVQQYKDPNVEALEWTFFLTADLQIFRTDVSEKKI